MAGAPHWPGRHRELAILGDVGIRSVQGGVTEAVNLRLFGPLLLSQVAADGAVQLWQYLPDLKAYYLVDAERAAR